MIEEEVITIKVLHATCGRCGHRWDLKRTDADGKLLIPKTCPSCHSPYWNAERKRKPKGDAAESAETPAEKSARQDEVRTAAATAARDSLESSRYERLKAQLAQLEARSRKA